MNLKRAQVDIREQAIRFWTFDLHGFFEREGVEYREAAL